MLTVVVGLEASGNSKTRKPLLNLYSVMPSTEARDSIFALAGADSPLTGVTSASARLIAKDKLRMFRGFMRLRGG